MGFIDRLSDSRFLILNHACPLATRFGWGWTRKGWNMAGGKRTRCASSLSSGTTTSRCARINGLEDRVSWTVNWKYWLPEFRAFSIGFRFRVFFCSTIKCTYVISLSQSLTLLCYFTSYTPSYELKTARVISKWWIRKNKKTLPMKGNAKSPPT